MIFFPSSKLKSGIGLKYIFSVKIKLFLMSLVVGGSFLDDWRFSSILSGADAGSVEIQYFNTFLIQSKNCAAN